MSIADRARSSANREREPALRLPRVPLSLALILADVVLAALSVAHAQPVAPPYALFLLVHAAVVAGFLHPRWAPAPAPGRWLTTVDLLLALTTVCLGLGWWGGPAAELTMADTPPF